MSAEPRSVRPVLGMVCCTRRVEPELAQAVMNRYVVSASTYADAACLLVPARPDLMQAREVAARLDGLLLTGSPSNVMPHRYGHGDAEDAEGPFDAGRDDMSAAMIDAMIELGRPVFGICRGFQEINVAFGGTLRRDTSRHPNLLAHHGPDESDFDTLFEPAHEVILTPGGVLEQAFGRHRLTVNSVHFQGADRVGSGLSIEARSPDGLVEGVSAQVGGARVVAVQWHPEWRAEGNADSQAFFRLLGQALRGETLPTQTMIAQPARTSA